jgi:hypothetical protein
MTSYIYFEKDSDTIYEEFLENDFDDSDEDYRSSDKMETMINRYGRY